MVSMSGRYVVSFNGEIYNHDKLRLELISSGFSFRSASDTEVLLVAFEKWGKDAISKLNGMFAFAIYDSHERKLIIARDRAGEKPLFYRLVAGEIRIASELKALLSDPRLSRTIDHEAFDCFLSMGYVPGDRCIWKSARKLPPSHYLEFDCNTGESKVSRYWNLPEYVEQDFDAETLVDRT